MENEQFCNNIMPFGGICALKAVIVDNPDLQRCRYCV